MEVIWASASASAMMRKLMRVADYDSVSQGRIAIEHGPKPPAHRDETAMNGAQLRTAQFDSDERATCRDADTGLDYFGARYFSSVQGRFLTPDWSATPEAVPYGHFEVPQSLNLYAYVKNNPITDVDVDGHEGAGGDPPAPDQGHVPPDSSFDPRNGKGKGPADGQEGQDKAQQQMGQDPTLPTAEAPPLISNQDIASAKTTIEFVALVGLPELGELGAAGKALSEAGEAAKAAKIEKLTTEAKELYPNLAKKADQLHHVIPKYLGGAKDGALAKIPAAYHQLITNAFRTLAPYGQAVSRTAEEVTNIVKQVYSMYPLP